MKTILTVLVTIIISQAAVAQFTLSARYENGSANEWENHIQSLSSGNPEFINSSFSIHAGYWIKVLKDYRWDLIPEAGYSFSSADVVEQFSNSYTWNRIDFTLNNHVYLFDIESDCNCPTFSKDGNVVTKGLFFNIAPGVSFNSFKHEVSEDGTLNSDSSNISYFGKLGFGFDLGLTDLITISPLFNFVIRPSVNWEGLGLDDTVSANEISSDINQTEFGIRLNMRFDYVRGNTGFRR